MLTTLPLPPTQTKTKQPMHQDIDALIKEKEALLSLVRATSQVRNIQDLITLFSKKIKGQDHHYDYAQLVLLNRQDQSNLSGITERMNTLLRNHDKAHLNAVYLVNIQAELLQYISNATSPVVVHLDPANKNPDSEINQKTVKTTGSSLDKSLEDFIRQFSVTANKGQMEDCLIMELKTKDHLIGLLLIHTCLPSGFSKEFSQLTEEITPLITSALLNIMDHEQILQKSWEESFLLAFSSGIAAVRTKDDLSEVVYGSLKKLSMVQAYFIRLIDPTDCYLLPFIHDKEAFYTKEAKFEQLLRKKISLKEGISRNVLKAGGPLNIDFRQEVENGTQDTYVEFWKMLGKEKSGFSKITGIPLAVAQKNIGILWVITEKIDNRLLEGISAQIAIAISNIKANEEILRKESEKATLLSLSQEMAALRDRNDLFQKFYSKVTAVLNIEEFGMVLLDQEKKTYKIIIDQAATFARLHPGQEALLEMEFHASDAVFQRITKSTEPVYFDVATLSGLPDMPAYVHFWKAIHLKQVAATPLKVGGKIIGAAFFHVDPVGKTPAYSALLQAVTYQLAVAISNIHSNEQVLQYKQMLEQENVQLREEINSLYNFSEIIGSGEKMQEVYRLIRLVATTNSTVLVLGETGTGKELIAKAVHNASPRKDKLMVKVNCAALPTNLIESELFGHEKGAFTGAVERRIGKFELANGGTIFLDEIGEMPLETQVKLLRVIQEREFERIGGKTPIKANVRIIAATNRKLDIEVNEGRFRPDLYYRLNVFPIHLPPLRDRKEDLEALTRYFVRKYSKRTGHQIKTITAGVYKDLHSYNWPGNIRELEHLIERSILLMDGGVLKQVQIPLSHTKNTEQRPIAGQGLNTGKRDMVPASEKMTLKYMEAEHIVKVLKICQGKIAGVDGAAALLGIPATTLHSKIKKLDIKKADYLD